MLTTKTYHYCLLLMLLFHVACLSSSEDEIKNQYGLMMVPHYYNPRVYDCKMLPGKPLIDGKINREEWDDINWSESFVSMVDAESPGSSYTTKFKLAYADDSLFFCAEVHDDHIWSTKDLCESYFFEDNFLELAIDCNNDEFDYLTIKFNAQGNCCAEYCNVKSSEPQSKFSLIQDNQVRCAVHINGTLNNPEDSDKFWSVEAAIPLNLKLNEIHLLRPSSIWKINVCRTRWTSTVVSGIYKKMINSQTGKKYPGEEWVWSPMAGYPVNMVELWGECHFGSDDMTYALKQQINHQREIKWELRNVYYAQHIHFNKHKRYAKKVAGLKDIGFDLSALIYKPDIKSSKKGFTIEIKDPQTHKQWRIDDEGRISSE
ncbi:hypothetical protein E9993_10695 [Labilibacter sediminis]|nr:hypothetical protein E9993_10695 [Labilibacter sediminis]